MYASFAAGTLIVLGVLIAFFAFLGGASLPFVMVGLGAILGAGVLSLLERRVAR
jgi:hypothetical protein